MVKCILDFDGVLASIHEHDIAYEKTFVSNLSQKTGVPLENVRRDFDEAKGDVLKRPWEYGWVVNNHRVEFGDEDPYILTTSASEVLYVKHPAYRFCCREDYYKFVEDTCRNSAGLLSSSIDEENKAALAEIAGRAEVVIISNGSRKRIENALDAADLRVEVFGRANKMIVDPSFDKIDRYLYVDGSRRIELRRPFYYDILNKLKGHEGVSGMVVVGDVLSMDLALPYILGMNIVLKENYYTPQWSKDFVAERGRVISSLGQVLDFI